MTAVLIGIVGLLGGVVAALWFRSQYYKIRATVDVLRLELKHETEEHDKSLDTAKAHASQYVADIERREQLIDYYRDRLAEIQSRRLESLAYDDLHDVANELFPVSEEDGDSDEVANEGSDGDRAVPADSPTE